GESRGGVAGDGGNRRQRYLSAAVDIERAVGDARDRRQRYLSAAADGEPAAVDVGQVGESVGAAADGGRGAGEGGPLVQRHRAGPVQDEVHTGRVGQGAVENGAAMGYGESAVCRERGGRSASAKRKPEGAAVVGSQRGDVEDAAGAVGAKTDGG